MTLREQVIQIAIRVVNEPWSRSASIDRVVDKLIVTAFMERWPVDSVDCRAIRRAREILDADNEYLDHTKEAIS